ncbi:hypothetical protein PIROE2DRAFT_6851, partial [Piromyces sp. E2]
YLNNNDGLYGRIPNIIYSKQYGDEPKCNFSGTHLCYSLENVNEICDYPVTYYDCAVCKDSNASVIDGICQCNSGYSGAGYIKCYESECSLINLSMLGRTNSYDCCEYNGIECTLGHITKIQLSGSDIYGTIPYAIGNLTQLTVLDLSNNNFYGSIPDSIGNLVSLKKLILNNNNLSGEVPIKGINKLTELCQISCEVECNFSNTKMCYSMTNVNAKCKYPDNRYDCINCQGSAYIKNDYCQCKEGYKGIGYIECEVDTNYGKC